MESNRTVVQLPTEIWYLIIYEIISKEKIKLAKTLCQLKAKGLYEFALVSKLHNQVFNQILNDKKQIIIDDIKNEIFNKYFKWFGGIDSKDDNNCTMLMYMSSLGDRRIVELLIENAANVNAQNQDGTTALMNAAISGKFEIVEKLISNGADIKIKDKQGHTVLDYAKFHNRKGIIAILKDHSKKQKNQKCIIQ